MDRGLSSLIAGGQSVTNQYLRLSGMQQERDLLQKLSMRFVHTSNKDVSLINNSRVPN